MSYSYYTCIVVTLRLLISQILCKFSHSRVCMIKCTVPRSSHTQHTSRNLLYSSLLVLHKLIFLYNNNIYLFKSHMYIYIEYNTNSGYKWTPQEDIDLYML